MASNWYSKLDAFFSAAAAALVLAILSLCSCLSSPLRAVVFSPYPSFYSLDLAIVPLHTRKYASRTYAKKEVSL